MEFVIFFLLFTLKAISLYFTPVDSDEVMWSIMAENIIKNTNHYLFFTDQNFRGSFEAYFLAPFQLLFGLNEYILRISNLVFGILAIYLVYKIIFDTTSNKIYSLCGSLIYFLALPEIFFIQNKAWGGYVTIQFIMLLSYYLFSKINQNTKTLYFSFLGLLLGLSFWINEQSIYFIFIIFAFSFFYDLKNLFLNLNKFNKILYLTFLGVISISIYFVIIKKRMFINFYNTLNEKLNLNWNFLNQNINFGNVFIAIALIFSIFLIINWVTKKYNFSRSLFLNSSIFCFLIISINVFNNSFARVYSLKSFDLSKSVNFLNTFILNNMFSYLTIPILGAVFFLIIKKYRNIKIEVLLQNKLENLIYSSFIAFPLLFVYSYLPGLTPNARYLIIWWPITVISLILLFSKIQFKKINFVYIVTFLWVLFWLSFYNTFFDLANNKINTQMEYKTLVSEIKNNSLQTCYGGYWNVGLVMFYSNLEIKCFTIKAPGIWYYKFLDQYKTSNLSDSYFIEKSAPFVIKE